MLDLVRDHRVLASDLLWFGDSVSGRTPSLDAQADALQALLAARGIRQVELVGILRRICGRRAGAPAAGGQPAGDRQFARSKVYTPPTCRPSAAMGGCGFAGRPVCAAGHGRHAPAGADGVEQDRRCAGLDSDDVRNLSGRARAGALPPDGRPAGQHGRLSSPLYRIEPMDTRLVWSEGDRVFPLAIGERLAQRLGKCC